MRLAIDIENNTLLPPIALCSFELYIIVEGNCKTLLALTSINIYTILQYNQRYLQLMSRYRDIYNGQSRGSNEVLQHNTFYTNRYYRFVNVYNIYSCIYDNEKLHSLIYRSASIQLRHHKRVILFT